MASMEPKKIDLGDIRDLYNNYDLSLESNEENNNRYINDIICKHLHDFSDKWFVEYSVLATTIDPQRNSTLRCFSFIYDESNTSFKNKIEQYVTPIISVLKDKVHDDNTWWFHNPETFLAPLQIEPYVSYTDNKICVDPNVVKDIEMYLEHRGYKAYKKRGNSFSYSSMEYPRTFIDILRYSKNLYDSQKEVCKDADELNSSLINHYHHGVREARSYYDYFVAEEKETFCYLTFPIIASHARFITPNIYKETYGDNSLQYRFQGLGHCFVYFNVKDTSPSKIFELEECIKHLFLDIHDALHNFSFNYTFNIGLLLQEKSKQEAEKSAKAAIMSRNMSHNLGSHVMSYLKQHLGSVKDMVTDGILADLVIGEDALKSTLNYTTENATLPFLMGVGHFVSYLQERQDFIATIATDYIPYFATVNFKDDIYDELNPDKRAERHSERKNGKTDNILLGNIARSEGLGRNTQPTEMESKERKSPLNDIVLKFRTHFNGNPVNEFDPEDKEKVDTNPSYAYKAEANRKKAAEELEELRKYDFSLPGGITGRQAVFSILENIIRNAAKHGKWQGKRKLEITFDVFTNQDYDRDRIPDNDNIPGCRSLRKVLEDFYFQASDADDVFFMTITDNCDFSPLALYKLQQGLKEKYVDGISGRMKDGNKGLKEMRISATWLRAISNEEECFIPHAFQKDDNDRLTDEEMAEFAKDGEWIVNQEIVKNKKAPIIYARICDPKNDRGYSIDRIPHLQYIICLNIPKKVAVVSSFFETDGKDSTYIDMIEEIRRRLIKNKWRAFTLSEFQNEKNKSFEFILCDDFDNKNIYDEVRPIATSRVFCMSQLNYTKTEADRQLFYDKLKSDDFFSKDDNSNSQAKCEELVMQLYRKLADYQGDEIITVDNNDPNNHLSCACDKVLSVDSQIERYSKFIYRRHHDSEKEFHDFMENHLKFNFVESITGSNSSDRLVCHEKLDESWFYRNLHAMKQCVAIFDERLFSKVTRLEESCFVDSDDADTKNNNALAALQRKVFCFTFIKDPADEKKFRLMGVLYNNGYPQYDTSYRCKCTRLATISFSHEMEIKEGKECKKGLEIVFASCVNKDDYEHIFDYITIHQGLLDKLYEAFGIKGSPNEKEDKELLTRDLFLHFSKQYKEFYTRQEKNHDLVKQIFLPGMIIHSGRSKPSTEDMPQRLPFIQYAALEHAALDCKYSLVELLDFARYEDN